MMFDEVLARVLDLLQRQGRVSYRALKRRFDLDDDYLEDLKAEIIKAQQLARDEAGEVLVWTGEAGQPQTPARDPERPPLAYTPGYLAEKILTAKHTLEGERKQVTMLFADLKGSTELSEGLDPEEARKLLDPALHVMMDAVHRYEGTVNQVLGDGIMALFGAPVAHEDHAVRACYAALAMQAAMRRYAEDVRRSHGLEMLARVGLNSGEVVVRAIGNDLHMDYSAVGQTTHLAARMEQLATPGSIRLTAATLRLAEGLVQVTALGQFPVRGLSEPVEVFELVGASTIRRRLQASAARGLTRFVGRQQELTALQRERFGVFSLPSVNARAVLAWYHAELGTFAEGRAFGEEGLRIAEADNRPESLIRASWGIGLLALRQGDLPRALPLLERAVSICHEADVPIFFSSIAAALGTAYTLSGRIADAVPLLTQAMEQSIAMELIAYQAPCGLSLGEAQLLAGRLEEAQALAERALALARAHQERGHQAYALRLLGDIAARRDPLEDEPAVAYYQQALTLAEELGMRPLQAHCRRGLGTLYARRGHWEQARTELAAAIALYRTMDMTFWLPQAEAVLAQAEQR